AARHHVAVIEDACEALGAQVDGRAVGGIGACGVFGFYPNKQITTGEGGMGVTNDAGVTDACRSMRDHGRAAGIDAATFNRLGFNYRLSELACALGLSQIARLDEILAARRAVAQRYDRRLADHEEVVRPAMDVPGSCQSWFVYVVRLSARFSR